MPAQGRERGRFAKGNKIACGPRRQSTIAKYKKWLDRALTEEDFDKVARAVLRKAHGGDVAAARLVFEYTVGPAAVAAQEHLDLRKALFEAALAMSGGRRQRRYGDAK